MSEHPVGSLTISCVRSNRHIGATRQLCGKFKRLQKFPSHLLKPSTHIGRSVRTGHEILVLEWSLPNSPTLSCLLPVEEAGFMKPPACYEMMQPSIIHWVQSVREHCWGWPKGARQGHKSNVGKQDEWRRWVQQLHRPNHIWNGDQGAPHDQNYCDPRLFEELTAYIWTRVARSWDREKNSFQENPMPWLQMSYKDITLILPYGDTMLVSKVEGRIDTEVPREILKDFERYVQLDDERTQSLQPEPVTAWFLGNISLILNVQPLSV